MQCYTLSGVPFLSPCRLWIHIDPEHANICLTTEKGGMTQRCVWICESTIPLCDAPKFGAVSTIRRALTATTRVDFRRSPSCTSGSGERMRPRVPWAILSCAARETHPSRSIAKMWWFTAPVEEQVKDRKSECIITANFTTQILGSRL